MDAASKIQYEQLARTEKLRYKEQLAEWRKRIKSESKALKASAIKTIVKNESLSQEYQQSSLPRAPSQHIPPVLTRPLKGPHHDADQQDQDLSLVRFLPTYQEQRSPNPYVPPSSSSYPLAIGMHSSLSAMTRENNTRQSVFMRRISYPSPDDDTSSRIEPTYTNKSKILLAINPGQSVTWTLWTWQEEEDDSSLGGALTKEMTWQKKISNKNAATTPMNHFAVLLMGATFKYQAHKIFILDHFPKSRQPYTKNFPRLRRRHPSFSWRASKPCPNQLTSSP